MPLLGDGGFSTADTDSVAVIPRPISRGSSPLSADIASHRIIHPPWDAGGCYGSACFPCHKLKIQYSIFWVSVAKREAVPTAVSDGAQGPLQPGRHFTLAVQHPVQKCRVLRQPCRDRSGFHLIRFQTCQ